MPVVVNRQTFEIRSSVNLPDHPYAQWVGGWDAGPTAVPELGPVIGHPKKHWVLTGDVFSVLDAQGQQDLSDLEDSQVVADKEADCQGLVGATEIRNTLAHADELPSPPPRHGLLVLLMDAGNGTPGLAVSSAVGWGLFEQTGEI